MSILYTCTEMKFGGIDSLGKGHMRRWWQDESTWTHSMHGATVRMNFRAWGLDKILANTSDIFVLNITLVFIFIIFYKKKFSFYFILVLKIIFVLLLFYSS